MKGRGFTLIELLISMSVLLIFIGGASMILIQVSGSSMRVEGVTDAQQTARQALDTLADEIRMAGGGAASGLVGIAPVGTVCSSAGNCSTRRIPVMWSGPDVPVTGPGGSTIVTNSIYVLTMEPAAGTPSSEPRSMLGVISKAAAGQPVTVSCADNAGTIVDCADATFGSNTIVTSAAGVYAPLLVGDFNNAVYLRPTSLSGSAGNQTLSFTEQSANAFSPDPKAPFGFAPGAVMGRARVVHYYLKQMPTGEYQLVRSHPTMTSTLPLSCSPSDLPFEDETTTAGGVVGTSVGSGPVESLQIRFVVDPLHSDDPTQYQVLRAGDSGSTRNHLTVCDGAFVPVLREVRLQLVARARATDRDTSAAGQRLVYTTPGFEGTSASGGNPDAYPRRTFETRVVPRNLQGILRL